MKSKLFFGFIVILVMSFTMSGCEEEEHIVWYFSNQSSYTILVEIASDNKNHWKPNSFSITSGNNKETEIPVKYYDYDNPMTFQWKRADSDAPMGNYFGQTGVEVDGGDLFVIFKDK